MTVRELFTNLNLNVANYNVYMRDIKTSIEHHNSMNIIMKNDDLYTDWKNAIVWSWSVVENEFIVTVEKEN